jgi:integrase
MARPRKPARKGWPDNLGQNPDGYFYYVNPTTKKKLGLGHDKADAFRQARQANAVLANMTQSNLVDRIMGVKGMTFKEWLPIAYDLWVERVKPAEKTQKNIRNQHRRFEDAPFAWKLLPNITVLDISSYLDDIEENNGVGMARNMRSRLSVIFEYAEVKGHIELGKNPVTPTHAPAYAPNRERLTLEQFILIRDGARNSSKPHLADAMDLGLLTAQRIGDICAVQFGDVKEGYIFFDQEKMQGATKLKLDINIRLDTINLSIADAIKRCRNKFVSSFLIHQTRNRGSARIGDGVSPDALEDAFAEMRDELKILPSEGKTPTTFHEIRSLAERLYKKEYGAEFAQAMLGHKSAKTTAVYDDLRGAWTEVKVK